MQLSQSVFLAHQEETLALEALLGSDLLLCKAFRLFCALAVPCCCLLVYGLDVTRHLKFIEDKLLVHLRSDLADDTRNLESFVRNFLQCERLEKLVLNEDLFDACVCCKFQTAQELVSALHFHVDLIAFAEARDLMEGYIFTVDQHQVLWLCLDEELLERISIHPCFQRQVTRPTLDEDVHSLRRVAECLRVLSLKVFEAIVGFNVGLLFDHVSHSLLHLHAFLLVQYQLLLFFFRHRLEQLLLVDLTVESETRTLVDLHGTVVFVHVGLAAKSRERIRHCEAFTIGFL